MCFYVCMYVCMFTSNYSIPQSICRVYNFWRRASSVLLCLVGQVRLALAIRRIWSAVFAAQGKVAQDAGGHDLISSAYQLWMHLRHQKALEVLLYILHTYPF